MAANAEPSSALVADTLRHCLSGAISGAETAAEWSALVCDSLDATGRPEDGLLLEAITAGGLEKAAGRGDKPFTRALAVVLE
eukprot:scaffold567812_cov41-Prasinocladus_malaysianus.AAC.1